MIKLVLTKPENLKKVALSNLRGTKNSSVNVLCNVSYDSLVKNDNWIAKKNGLFIDTISESKHDNVIFVSASNLTGLSIAINQVAQTLNGEIVVIFHSLTSLALKNEPATIGKFVTFIMKRASDWKVDVIFVISEESISPIVVNLLKQSADKIIK